MSNQLLQLCSSIQALQREVKKLAERVENLENIRDTMDSGSSYASLNHVERYIKYDPQDVDYDINAEATFARKNQKK